MILVMTRTDNFEFELLETYCLGKSKLWNLFFGRRKTVEKKLNNPRAYYKISRKDYKIIKTTAINMIEKYDYWAGTFPA